MNYIVEILNECQLDILCLTETWLLPSDVDIIRATLPESFSISHVPRTSNSGIGGGVAVIHSAAINLKHNIGTMQYTHNTFEIIDTNFTCHGTNIHILVIYRPGHSGTDRTFLDEFGTLLDCLLPRNGKIIICGDFNYWMDDPTSKPYSTEFMELLEAYNFINHVSFPTHTMGHTLDLILTPSYTDCIGDVSSFPIDRTISDHVLITFSLRISRKTAVKKAITFRNYKKVNMDTISQEIASSLDVASVLTPTAENLVMHYNTSLRSLEERHFPEITKHILVKEDCDWYDHSVASLRRERRKAERKWRQNKTDASRLSYTAARKAVVDQAERCKVKHFQDRWASCGGDQKRFYAIVRDLMHGNTQLCLPSSESDIQLATEFLEFFHSKISRIREELDHTQGDDRDLSIECPPQPPPAVMLSEFRPVTAADIRKYVGEMNKTHCSLDPINVSKIIKAYESAFPFIAMIINQTFADCSFTTSEKLALLRPLLKKAKEDIENKNNFRPVSNLSFLSKIIERAMLDQLLSFFEQCGIISRFHSAYREFHSTESALCRIHNDLVTGVCSGRSTLLVLLDLSAAFDTIDHDLLLGDLHSCGVRGSALLLLESYLKDRCQRVTIRQSISESKPLLYGVPQGSVLGPVLFILYTSGLANLLEAHRVNYHFYADDTQIYVEINEVEDIKLRMSSLLRDIKIWMTERKLKLNEGKTDIMIAKGNFRSDIDDFGALDIGGTQLLPSASVRNLGVTFDSTLNYRSHINALIKCCNLHIRNLYAVRRYMNRDTLVTLVTSLIVSRVDYCNSLFVGLPNYLLKKIQSILNRCARLVFSLPPRVPTTPYMIELHWLPVKARIEFKICLLVFKALKFSQPKYILDLISRPDPEPSVALRSSDDPFRLHEPRAVRERVFAERSFVYTAPRLYNRLPAVIKQQNTLQGFKTHLKTFLFTQAYDTDNNILNENYRL